MIERSEVQLDVLERLAPGSALRAGLERILQSGRGALLVIGTNSEVDAISTGGFVLEKTPYTAARLAELAKMDGGIVLADGGATIVRANVHFVPDSSIPTDETGSRHRTAERIAIQTELPVVSVSEGRNVATLYVDGAKIELPRPETLAARVSQELQNLDRLRRQLDDSEQLLTVLEVSGNATYRSVVTLIQRAELVRRVGHALEVMSVSLGEEGGLAGLQLSDLMRGVVHTRNLTLRDHLDRRSQKSFQRAVRTIEEFSDAELVDPSQIGKALGFDDLDVASEPRGMRLLSKAGRIPESVRETVTKKFAY
ncbi:MAG: DNA integrity scanning diadenylate cyclase DisA, partial [Acidimicrobiia bacterium]|nr:DNA integrity scanning diadenylate cyclase DisA [Acidimicrobiia bacterium]